MIKNIQTEIVQYSDPISGDDFQGVISWDRNIASLKPSILVSHAFAGQLEFEEQRTIELAESGYVAFALDVYGKGRRANTPDKALKLMAEMDANRALLLHRMNIAVQVLTAHAEVDNKRIGAIGFCFGGKCVLDLARSGTDDVHAVVSFHGLFDKPDITHAGDIKASILIQHGWLDPMARPEGMRALADELESRNADWQIHVYGQTGHSFTNPAATDREAGLFYQSLTHKRAWLSMLSFFDQHFTQGANRGAAATI